MHHSSYPLPYMGSNSSAPQTLEMELVFIQSSSLQNDTLDLLKDALELLEQGQFSSRNGSMLPLQTSMDQNQGKC